MSSRQFQSIILSAEERVFKLVCVDAVNSNSKHLKYAAAGLIHSRLSGFLGLILLPGFSSVGLVSQLFAILRAVSTHESQRGVDPLSDVGCMYISFSAHLRYECPGSGC